MMQDFDTANLLDLASPCFLIPLAFSPKEVWIEVEKFNLNCKSVPLC